VALDKEEARLAAKAGGDLVVAAAYLKLMPLLWERTAISNFLKDNPSLRGALLHSISRPVLNPMPTASSRLLAPSLRSSDATWNFTV